MAPEGSDEVVCFDRCDRTAMWIVRVTSGQGRRRIAVSWRDDVERSVDERMTVKDDEAAIRELRAFLQRTKDAG
jgi:hypothetical protein